MTTLAPKNALFLDIETTGLDPWREQIMEIGFALVDTDTWEITKVSSGLVYTPELRFRLENDMIDDFIKDMHTKSGLLHAIQAVHERTDEKDVDNYSSYEDRIIRFLEDEWGITRRNPSWGSSVHFDRRFLAAKMPKLNELMHYRIVDSSSEMERIKLRYPSLWKKIDEDPTKFQGSDSPDHRVIEDIRHSVDLERRLDKWVYRPAASCADIQGVQ